jgi:hypothetical protein
MNKFLYLSLILLIVVVIWNMKQEHLMIPGVANRTETKASFIEDRDWFDKDEKNFYSRYKT